MKKVMGPGIIIESKHCIIIKWNWKITAMCKEEYKMFFIKPRAF